MIQRLYYKTQIQEYDNIKNSNIIFQTLNKYERRQPLKREKEAGKNQTKVKSTNQAHFYKFRYKTEKQKNG